MYSGYESEQAERYERKLQLVQAVRAENQANQLRIQHRNNLFYNMDGEYSGKTNYDTDVRDSVTPQLKWRSFFGVRLFLSALCVLCFWGLKQGTIKDIAGLNAKEIKAYVSQDFSKVVVDYMKNFTYTLNYEKTSIK